MKGLSNVGGDYGSPTKFYGLSGDPLLYFSTGDFASFTDCRFSFSRVF
jgi:hypothetical protein